jgi:hypothetical protein
MPLAFWIHRVTGTVHDALRPCWPAEHTLLTENRIETNDESQGTHRCSLCYNVA